MLPPASRYRGPLAGRFDFRIWLFAAIGRWSKPGRVDLGGWAPIQPERAGLAGRAAGHPDRTLSDRHYTAAGAGAPSPTGSAPRAIGRRPRPGSASGATSSDRMSTARPISWIWSTGSTAKCFATRCWSRTPMAQQIRLTGGVGRGGHQALPPGDRVPGAQFRQIFRGRRRFETASQTKPPPLCRIANRAPRFSGRQRFATC